MKQYDLEKTVVHCQTKEQFEKVLRWHDSKGNEWEDNDSPLDYIDDWYEHVNCTCLELCNHFCYDTVVYFTEENYTILSFSDFEINFLLPIYLHKDRHTHTGEYPHDGKYVIDGECRLKSPESGKWFDVVMYRKVGGDEIFVREKESFDNEFELKID